jgi:hypothetical protein
VEATGWSLEYIESLSVRDWHEFRMVQIGKRKGEVAIARKRADDAARKSRR